MFLRDPPVDFEEGDRDGEPEAARTCTARIDEENAGSLFELRPVRLTSNDCGKASGLRIGSEVVHVVEEPERATIHFDQSGVVKCLGPLAGPCVPTSSETACARKLCNKGRRMDDQNAEAPGRT